jgi:hypothetical protein
MILWDFIICSILSQTLHVAFICIWRFEHTYIPKFNNTLTVNTKLHVTPFINEFTSYLKRPPSKKKSTASAELQVSSIHTTQWSTYHISNILPQYTICAVLNHSQSYSSFRYNSVDKKKVLIKIKLWFWTNTGYYRQ